MDMTEVRRFDQAQVGTIKLSKAIRIGAKKHPHSTFGVLMGGGRTCALGAAAVGRGWNGNQSMDVRGVYLPDVRDQIWHEISAMNDYARYTREQIAAWLEAQGL